MSRLRVLAYGLLVAAAVLKGVAGLLLGLTVVLATELLILRLQLTNGQAGNVSLPWPWRRKKVRAPFPSYERIAGDLSWAHYSVRDFDHGLRKRLLRAVEVRLSDGSGIDLAKQPEQARALLGEHAWSVLRPGEPARDDRSEPGYELRTLDEVVRAIESLPSTTSAEKEHP